MNIRLGEVKVKRNKFGTSAACKAVQPCTHDPMRGIRTDHVAVHAQRVGRDPEHRQLILIAFDPGIDRGRLHFEMKLEREHVAADRKRLVFIGPPSTTMTSASSGSIPANDARVASRYWIDTPACVKNGSSSPKSSKSTWRNAINVFILVLFDSARCYSMQTPCLLVDATACVLRHTITISSTSSNAIMPGARSSLS